MPAGLLADPLDYIFADHFRQRVLCNLLEELADAASLDVGKAQDVLAYIRTDMPIHIRDEEDDLFPLMRRRCAPEDEIDALLAKLGAEHAADDRFAKEIVEGLATVTATGAPVRSMPDLRHKMLAFARSQRRHLMVENSILLPIARARLTRRDRTDLGKRMAARRGIELAPDGGTRRALKS